MRGNATMVKEMAAFIVRASYEDLSQEAGDHLKIRVLDALGCAFRSLNGAVILKLRQHLEDFDGASYCSMIGGRRGEPGRYLDFNDKYLAAAKACHPSDSLGPVLAAAEYVGANDKDLLTALAVVYQVQCRLSDAAQGSFAIAADVSKPLWLEAGQTANALAMAGAACNALGVSRTGHVSDWKGLAYPNTAFGVTRAAFLTVRGIAGPLEVFEGYPGVKEHHTRPLWAGVEPRGAGPCVAHHREALQGLRSTPNRPSRRR